MTTDALFEMPARNPRERPAPGQKLGKLKPGQFRAYCRIERRAALGHGFVACAETWTDEFGSVSKDFEAHMRTVHGTDHSGKVRRFPNTQKIKTYRTPRATLSKVLYAPTGWEPGAEVTVSTDRGDKVLGQVWSAGPRVASAWVIPTEPEPDGVLAILVSTRAEITGIAWAAGVEITTFPRRPVPASADKSPIGTWRYSPLRAGHLIRGIVTRDALTSFGEPGTLVTTCDIGLNPAEYGTARWPGYVDCRKCIVKAAGRGQH